MEMIKRQYRYGQPSYFNNFIESTDNTNKNISEVLTLYNATVAKSKDNNIMNVKWHDKELYIIFVLRYS